MRRRNTQINKIRYEKGKVTTNTWKIQEIIRDCFEKPIFEYIEKSRRNEQISRNM
jgi:hypothetical protein